jgi:hypothetical protein
MIRRLLSPLRLGSDAGGGGLSYQPYKEVHREKLTASADDSRRSEGGSKARAIDDHDPIRQGCVVDLCAVVPCHSDDDLADSV